MKDNAAQAILDANRTSYDRMSGEFSSTRGYFWKELEFLAEHATPGMRVLDIGCGNGRFFPLLAARSITYTGVDNSEGLLRAARQLHPHADFVVGDATALPFEDQQFDIAFSFATIHHIPGIALQKKFITEAARVLRPGSTFILTAWDLSTPRYIWKVRKASLLRLLGLSRLDRHDVWLTFGKDRHQRYVHAFTLHELETLLRKNGFNVIGSECVERIPNGRSDPKKLERNILVVAKKQ